MGLKIRGTDGRHPNDLGYSLIAKNVYDKLSDLKMIKSEPL